MIEPETILYLVEVIVVSRYLDEAAPSISKHM